MIGKLSLLGALLAVVLGLAAPFPPSSAQPKSAPATYRAEVVMHPELPNVLTEDADDAAWGVASFGQPFSSLQKICVSLRFSSDLLDPGETIHYLAFYFPDGLMRYGHTNSGPDPLRRTGPSCFVSDVHPRELRAFKDGRQRLTLSTPRGSVKVARVVVTAIGSR